MTEQNENPATGTQLLDRAVSILRYLGDAGQAGTSMAMIGEALSLKQSTVHRIVSALERHGLVVREKETKRYRLGLTLFAMGARAADGTGLRQIARPSLLRLSAGTGDSVFLMARAGVNTVCVDRQQGAYVIDSLTGHVGGEIPMGVGAASQSILAFLPEREASVIIEVNAPLYSRYGDLSAAKVTASLESIRRKGFALDNGDLVAGIAAIAVPILPQGRDAIAAIAINLTSARLSEERLPELVAMLQEEVRSIEEQLNPLEEPRMSARIV